MKKKVVLSALSLALLIALSFTSDPKGSATAADDHSVLERTGGSIIVGVMPFETDAEETKDDEPEEITDAREKIAREALLQSLARSRSVAALKSEVIDNAAQELGVGLSEDAGEKDAAEVGRRAGAQYMILGKLTKISQRNDVTETNRIFSKSYETAVTASAQLHIRIVDVNSGKVVMNLPGYGVGRTAHSSKSVGGFNLGGWVGLLQGAVELSAKLKASNLQDEEAKAEAIADASADLANKIKGELAGEYLHVRDAKGDENIEINADSTAGVNEEDLYLIYLDGSEKRDEEGILIEREVIPLAVVKVDKIHRGYSVARVVPSGGNSKLIRQGDKASPISRTGARELAVEKKFVKERPKGKASSETHDAVFGDGGKPLTSSQPAAAEVSGTSAVFKWNDIEGVDRDNETGFKLISIYPLEDAEKNTLSIAHRGAYNLYSHGKYKEAFEAFTKLAMDYNCNYLSAYWAGMSATSLKNNEEAIKWFDKALEINKDYEPAIDAKADLEKL
jgi:tetratricopeptide (TPR) repeat protein